MNFTQKILGICSICLLAALPSCNNKETYNVNLVSNSIEIDNNIANIHNDFSTNFAFKSNYREEQYVYPTTIRILSNNIALKENIDYQYKRDDWEASLIIYKQSIKGDIEIHANLEDVPKKSFDILWKNYDGATLETDVFNYGQIPIYQGDEPKHPESEGIVFTFSGWNPEIHRVNNNFTYIATFSASPGIYPVNWVNWDDTPIMTDYVEGGKVPIYTGSTPIKEDTKESVWTFSGWDKPLAPVTGEVTYKATFKPSPRFYTIKWLNYNDSVIETDSVAYGDTPSYHGATPTKPSDVVGSYTFAGWDKEIVPVEGDTDYKANFDVTYIDYSFTFAGTDCKIEGAKGSYHYGETITCTFKSTKTDYLLDETILVKVNDKQITEGYSYNCFTGEFSMSCCGRVSIELSATFVPYSVITLDALISREFFEFGYAGKLRAVDWGDGVIDNSSRHKFGVMEDTDVKVYGDKLTDLHFGYSNGNDYVHYEGYQYIINLEFSNCITNIPDYGCFGLNNYDFRTVKFNSFVNIGEYAFQDCSMLYSVTFVNDPEGKCGSKIGRYAFAGCPLNNTHFIEATVIDSFAFSNSFGYFHDTHEITIRSEIISEKAFVGLSNRTKKFSITFENTKNVSSNAFWNSYIYSFKFPITIESIGSYIVNGDEHEYPYMYYYVTLIDLTEVTSVPTASPKPFHTHNYAEEGKTKILVPNALLESFKTAENWSAYSGYMQGV